MYIRVRDQGLELAEPENFKAFKVVIELADPSLGRSREMLRPVADLVDEKTAWVDSVALRGWKGVHLSAEWLTAFDKMVEKAKPFGWVDEKTGAIRAHVEGVAGS